MRLTWLGTLGGHESRAYGVALVAPVVVGWSYDASGKKRAFRWDYRAMQDLGTLGGDESEAYAVSENGEVVVGWACDGSGKKRAFRWTQQTGMQDLGTLGGDESAAYGISANGDVVVGWAEDHNKRRRAFYWQGGNMYDLGTLGGDNSEACGVSAGGELVVGWSENMQGHHEAFYWVQSPGGSITPLSTPGGYIHSYALGMTTESILVGQKVKFAVVGYAETSSGVCHALLWELTKQLSPFQPQPPVVSPPRILVGSYTPSKAYSASYDPPPGSGAVGMSLTVVGEANGSTVLWRLPTRRQSQATCLCLFPIISSRSQSRLEVARAISSFRSNPRCVVGWGYNSSTRRIEAFLLVL